MRYDLSRNLMWESEDEEEREQEGAKVLFGELVRVEVERK
jgi:hypothetical protein